MIVCLKLRKTRNLRFSIFAEKIITMAKTNNPLITGFKVSKDVSNRQFIFKRRKGSTFLSKYPDMSNVVPSASQLQEKSKFALAVKYAREIVSDPVRKATYKARPGSTVYHSAIRDYLAH
jgi:hypothetical protein